MLLHSCADTVVRASMELGGNAPFLVLEGADVEKAVAGAMVAKMRNGGSACTAANRFYVHRSVAEAFTRRLAEEMGALRLGPGLEAGVQLGALVSTAERDKVAALVDGALAAGARCVVGGAVPDGDGAFYPATVLADVDVDAELLDARDLRSGRAGRRGRRRGRGGATGQRHRVRAHRLRVRRRRRRWDAGRAPSPGGHGRR